MSTEQCVACLEDYKGKRIAKVTCQYCPVSACRGCQQTYLLQSYADPHCMQCKRGWSSEFMAANFPLSFRNDVLRKHRRKILLEREKSLLPAMQVYVEYRRNMNTHQKEMETIRAALGDIHSRIRSPEDLAKLSREDAEKISLTAVYRYTVATNQRQRDGHRIRGIKQEIHTILKHSDAYSLVLASLPDTAVRVEEEDVLAKISASDPAWHEIKALKAQQEIIEKKLAAGEDDYAKLDTEYRDLYSAYNDATTAFWNNKNLYEGNDTGEQRATRREFIMKCSDETCRGFLSSNYKCGTCEKWTCSQCLVTVGLEKDSTHVCNPDTVATAKAIKAETRPCPKCGTRIFKIDGCNQMWCVMEGCNTAFSWDSGHVIVGTIHNPHYYEWLRRQGGGAPAREVGDIPCGGLPAIHQLMGAVRDSYVSQEDRGALFEIHRNLRELIDMRLRDYPARQPQLTNKDADVDYLTNLLTEDGWQRQLELSEAKFLRKKEIGQILQTLATAGADMMNQITNQAQQAASAGAALERAARVPPPRPVVAATGADIHAASAAAAAALEKDRQARAAAKASAVTVKHEAAVSFAAWLRDIGMPGLEQLRVFGNDSLKNLAKRDRMAVPQFEEQWRWVPHRAIYKPKKPEAVAAV